MAGTWNERNFKDLLEFSRKEMGKLCDQAYTKRLGITSRLFWQANKSPMWLVNMVILMFFSLCGWSKLLTDDDEWPRVKSCTEEYFPCTMTVFYDPESIFNIIPHRPDWIACLVSNLCKFEERSKLKETSLGFFLNKWTGNRSFTESLVFWLGEDGLVLMLLLCMPQVRWFDTELV